MLVAYHISNIFLYWIQFALCRFRSPLLTTSQLISFPAGTKTFQFPALTVLTDLKSSLIQESLVQHVHTARQSISQLVAPFIAFPSQVIHLIEFGVLLHGLINLIIVDLGLVPLEQPSLHTTIKIVTN
jgi:hypothetical protein